MKVDMGFSPINYAEKSKKKQEKSPSLQPRAFRFKVEMVVNTL